MPGCLSYRVVFNYFLRCEFFSYFSSYSWFLLRHCTQMSVLQKIKWQKISMRLSKLELYWIVPHQRLQNLLIYQENISKNWIVFEKNILHHFECFRLGLLQIELFHISSVYKNTHYLARFLHCRLSCDESEYN